MRCHQGIKMRFDLSLYTKYRAELMGIAAMLIIICHAYANGVEMSIPMQKILCMGGHGVDMFLFLSGMGLTCSLENVKSKGNLLDWYKRRYIRILIPYLLFAIPFYAIIVLLEKQTVLDYFLKVSTLSYWINGWGLWYVAMLIPLYLLTPIIVRLVTGNNGIVWLGVLILFSALFAMVPVQEKSALRNVQFCIERLPSFCLGIYMWRAIREAKKISLWVVLVIPIVVYAVLYVLNHTLCTHFSLFWLLSLPLLTISSLLLKRGCGLRLISGFMGDISLESYCTNVIIPSLFIRIFHLQMSLCWYCLIVVICILLSVVVNRIAKRILKLRLQ